MKSVTSMMVRLVALAMLCLSVSACVTTDNQAYYYNPSNMYAHPAGANSLYGYNAVDFNALGVR